MTTYLYVHRRNLMLNKTRSRKDALRTVIVSNGKDKKWMSESADILCPECHARAAILRYDPGAPVDEDAKVFVEAFGKVKLNP